MKEFFKKNKLKILVFAVSILFVAYIVNGINEHTVIPDHIHSIDDKASEEWTDEEKITVLKRTLQNEPDNIEAMLKLADLYIHTGDNKSAKKTIDKVLEIDPYNKEATVLQSELK
ncbi:MAG TPA: tetratricopeptide repeat protein [Ignavibacteria bacterium]|nr:tetratricopeptide repeat protein [Ignavibacteria bacterium]HQY52509.1 tetratricopeptide repeat protein [Ignavibacteria bacterium]HRB00201.1 tetratricopeptide repeat protein [Ignavibacteria bacterium]